MKVGVLATMVFSALVAYPIASFAGLAPDADGDGIPVPTSRGVPGNLSTGIQVKVPANAVAFVSGLRPAIADSAHPSPRQAPVARSRRVSGLVLVLLLVALATILFLMATVVFRARRQRRMPPRAS